MFTTYSVEQVPSLAASVDVERSICVLALLNLRDAVQPPAGRKPKMFMEEVLSVLDLVIVNIGAELDVPLCLIHPLLKLQEQHMLSLYMNLLSQTRKQSTEARLVRHDGPPAFAPVSFDVKVITALDIHRKPRCQPELSTNGTNSFWAEDLADIDLNK